VDLFVGHWAVAHPGHANNADRLYLNNGDGTFTNVSDGCGIHTSDGPAENIRPALAAIAAHLDDDLWPDIWVGNIMDPPPHQYDFIYNNNGDSTFSDNTANSPGVGDDAPAAMGFTIGDIELDGDWDGYISDIFSMGDAPLGNPLYLGNGDGTFADNSADVAGVQSVSSWGVNFIDVDQDRYPDLFVASMTNGQIDELYINDQDGTFTLLSAASGINVQAKARGSAAADYDGDGDLDIVVTYVDNSLTLYRNDTVGAGHWLQVELVGAFSNRDAIGSVVKATVGGDVLMRQVFGGNSAHSQDMLALHFGLDDATTVDQVEILWPSGIVDVLSGVPADQHITVPECTPDINRDGFVGTADLLAMLGAWGTDPGGLPDLDFNGVVSTSDLLVLLSRWGPCL
jgi:hypothetical protein